MSSSSAAGPLKIFGSEFGIEVGIIQIIHIGGLLIKNKIRIDAFVKLKGLITSLDIILDKFGRTDNVEGSSGLP